MPAEPVAVNIELKYTTWQKYHDLSRQELNVPLNVLFNAVLKRAVTRRQAKRANRWPTGTPDS